MFRREDQRYDAAEIRGIARRLETAAILVVGAYAFTGLFFGTIVGYLVGGGFGNRDLGALIGLAAGGVVGYLLGDARMLWQRLQAQLALCQVAIEENTREAVINIRADGRKEAAPAACAAAPQAADAAPAHVGPLPIPRASDRIQPAAPPINARRFQRCDSCGAMFSFADTVCPTCGYAVG